MKYYLIAYILLFNCITILSQTDSNLESLYKALFPLNSEEEQKVELGSSRLNPDYIMLGRKNQPDLKKASKYLSILRQSNIPTVLEKITLFREKYDSLFQVERMIPFKGIKIPYNYNSPEYLFYKEFDIAIYSLNLNKNNLSVEDKFNIVLEDLEKNTVMGSFTYLTDNVDIFLPFIKSRIDYYISQKDLDNHFIINYFVKAFAHSTEDSIDRYLINISNKLKPTRYYYTCLIILSQLGTDRALIYLIQEKEENPNIPVFSYLIATNLIGKTEAAKAFINYVKKLDVKSNNYNYKILTISKFQTPEVVNFFINQARDSENKELYRKELNNLRKKDIGNDEKEKINAFLSLGN